MPFLTSPSPQTARSGKSNAEPHEYESEARACVYKVWTMPNGNVLQEWSTASVWPQVDLPAAQERVVAAKSENGVRFWSVDSAKNFVRSTKYAGLLQCRRTVSPSWLRSRLAEECNCGISRPAATRREISSLGGDATP